MSWKSLILKSEIQSASGQAMRPMQNIYGTEVDPSFQKIVVKHAAGTQCVWL